MALTNQPYLPLFVDDWMNNNKLKMCSAAAHGVMISIMCIMHKEASYGKILLKQKFKQSDNQIKNFASQVAKLSSFDSHDVEVYLSELLSEGVLLLEDDALICSRMVKDFEVSKKRANAGRSGGNSNKSKNFAYAKDKANNEIEQEAKPEANAVIVNGYVNVIENESKNVNENGISKTKKVKLEISKSEILFPFSTETFKVQWQLWKTYKAKEHNFKYKSIQSEQASLVELSNLSQGHENVAIAIMNQSMAKGWKGFFELKNKSYGNERGNNSDRSDADLKESANDAVDAMFGVRKPS